METQVEADVYVLAAGANSSKVAAQVGLTGVRYWDVNQKHQVDYLWLAAFLSRWG